MVDPAVINALKALTKATEDQTRALKELGQSTKRIQNVLEAFNSNYVEVNRKDPNVD